MHDFQGGFICKRAIDCNCVYLYIMQKREKMLPVGTSGHASTIQTFFVPIKIQCWNCKLWRVMMRLLNYRRRFETKQSEVGYSLSVFCFVTNSSHISHTKRYHN